MSVLIALFLTDRAELWRIYTIMAVRIAMQVLQALAAAASMLCMPLPVPVAIYRAQANHVRDHDRCRRASGALAVGVMGRAIAS